MTTLKEKINIMKAAEKGKQIEFTIRNLKNG